MGAGVKRAIARIDPIERRSPGSRCAGAHPPRGGPRRYAARLMRCAIAIGLALGACGDAAPPRVLAHLAGELVEGLGCAPDGCVAACVAAGCDDGRRPGLVVLSLIHISEPTRPY